MTRTLLPGLDDRVEMHSVADAAATGLPVSLLVLLESLRAHRDHGATDEHEQAVLEWDPHASDRPEIPFWPGRVLLQDFTGIPALADLAALREAVARLGGDPTGVRPVIPADLVVDHSVTVDVAGRPDAAERNAALEFDRNRERYEFLRWGQASFPGLGIVPPNTGICHQVNLERLATVVSVREGLAAPDTVLGTDSHTPMVNGLGVLGWGVGGIEAESAMLGQPVTFLVPDVVGLHLHGSLQPGVTATDLVLTITERLRAHGVVGRFVEAHGPAVAELTVPARATISNMSPEYGSTCVLFPIDDRTLEYLRLTGRAPSQVALVEAYAKAQGLWHDPGRHLRYSSVVDLDLTTVEACVAGPSRPQDRVPLGDLPDAAARAVDGGGVPLPRRRSRVDEGSIQSFPASDPPAAMAAAAPPDGPDNPVEATSASPASNDAPIDTTPTPHEHEAHAAPPHTEHAGTDLVDADVVIAAITSCTNTSNPEVMIAAGLLARNAVERGLTPHPWVKASLAPGSRAVMSYLSAAGLDRHLAALGFELVGYGCTTCIGNSGPLDPHISEAIRAGSLAVSAVLSGNRNFEARIHPEVRMNWLASPPLVVAYALAGTVNVALDRDPIGTDADGAPVHLRDLWPTPDQIGAVLREHVTPDVFTDAARWEGDERWRSLPTPDPRTFEWRSDSTYVRRPPFLDDVTAQADPPGDVHGARALLVLGDSVTTDHISPAGAIGADTPAGQWLREHGVEPHEFNSYGSRRANHEVMVRGTFANPRLRNLLVPGVEGGVTVHQPSGDRLTVYEASRRYADEGVPLVVVAGRDYGSGSSRDWAAKGTLLLGVRAVLATSFERIHRSNLVGMGVAPIELDEPLDLDPAEIGAATIDIEGIAAIAGNRPPYRVTGSIGDHRFTGRLRVDSMVEAEVFAAGGILPHAARRMSPSA
jgi:aconitate hydratase